MEAALSPTPLVNASRRLSKSVAGLSFAPPVAFVYNPLDYAWKPHAAYLERYGSPGKEAVFVGMNPGPFGMAQTGVPFGDVSMVRDWMGIEEPVSKPAAEHPARPVEGFACPRSEVSGTRLWGWARDRFETPGAFFARFFVLNYCPLAFIEESGRNLTPDKLPAAERAPLEAACDEALRAAIDHLQPGWVIGVGKFAEKRAKFALKETGFDPKRIGTILHPSPASPHANRGWAEAAEKQLAAMGIL